MYHVDMREKPVVASKFTTGRELMAIVRCRIVVVRPTTRARRTKLIQPFHATTKVDFEMVKHVKTWQVHACAEAVRTILPLVKMSRAPAHNDGAVEPHAILRDDDLEFPMRGQPRHRTADGLPGYGDERDVERVGIQPCRGHRSDEVVVRPWYRKYRQGNAGAVDHHLSGSALR
jgi:hypothetical protein